MAHSRRGDRYHRARGLAVYRSERSCCLANQCANASGVGDSCVGRYAVSASSRRVASALGAFALLSLPEYGAVHAAASDNDVGRGQTLYSAYCAACHQANGEGVAGAFPPLKGSGSGRQ
jgi:hypothetical protein